MVRVGCELPLISEPKWGEENRRITHHERAPAETANQIQILLNDNGQDLIEYALLAGFISLVAVVAITNVGAGVNAVYGNINGQVAAIPGGSGS